MDFGTSNEHSLSFVSSGRPLISLLEAVYQMHTTHLRIAFDNTGLHLNEFTNEQTIVLFATLHARVFEQFHTTGKGVIAVPPRGLITVLKYGAIDDKIKFVYDHKKPKFCTVEIIKEEKGGLKQDKYVFELMTYFLEEDERALYVPQQETYDAEVKIPARDVHNFINTLLALEHASCPDSYSGDGVVKLLVSDSMILMEKVGHSISATITMLTEKGKEAREKGVLNPYKRTVLHGLQKTFLLRHLQFVNKFFMINPNKDASLTVFIKKNPPTFPIIFAIPVGDLGQAHVALCPAPI